MKLFRTAGRLVMAASLLASLLALPSGAAAAATTVGTLFPYSVELTPTKAADGTSYYKLTFADSTLTSMGVTVLNITASGGTFLTGTGTFKPANFSYPRPQLIIADPAQVIVNDPLTTSELWLVSSTAGTATVTVMAVKVSTVTDSAQSYTFTTATATTVSTSNSSSRIAADMAPYDPVATTPADAGVIGLYGFTAVKDTNNKTIDSGVTVTWTITGPATFDDGKATATSTMMYNATYYRSPELKSTGVAGTATLATSIEYLGKTYTLSTKTLAFAGAVDSAKLKANVPSIPTDDSNNDPNGMFGATNGKELIAIVNDAAGLPVSTGVNFAVGAYGTSNIISVDAGSAYYDATIKGYYLDVDCDAAGTSTVTLTATKGLVTKTSTAATFTCADPLTEAAPGTFTMAAGAKSVAPGKNMNILVTVKNKAGLFAPDGTNVTAATNDGAITSAGGGSTAKTVNGVATFIFLAPPAEGTATITAFVANSDGPHSLAVTISKTAVEDEGPVSLKADAKSLVYGAKSTLTIAFASVTAAQTFDLETSPDGTTGWVKLTDATGLKTDASGAATFAFTPKANAWYRVAYKDADAKDATSGKVQILVRSSLTFKPHSAKVLTVKKGAKVTFTATVKPIAGAKVRFSVFRRVDGEWTLLKRTNVPSNATSGVAKFSYTFSTKGSFYVRSVVLGTATNISSIQSALEKYTVK